VCWRTDRKSRDKLAVFDRTVAAVTAQNNP